MNGISYTTLHSVSQEDEYNDFWKVEEERSNRNTN